MVDTSRIIEELDRGKVVIVAGFQGVSDDMDVTTLGRGASDLSAVAIAAALGADRCEVYSDVEGIFTADPRLVPDARRLDEVGFEEMLEMASLGANVLQGRAAELAMRHHVVVQILSAFDNLPGTQLVDEDVIVEQRVVSGIAYSRDEAKITLTGIPDRPGIAASIFGPLSEASVNVDMIVQNASDDGASADLTFTVGKADLARATEVIGQAQDILEYQELLSDSNVVKVSVIGVGMRTHAGVATKMFETLADKGINIQVISTSEIKVSVLIAEEYTELALRSLHTAYGLDEE